MSETDDRLIVLPVKIRDGVLARLDLPAKLTPAEADRLAAIIRAWATDDMDKATSGRGKHPPTNGTAGETLAATITGKKRDEHSD